MHGCFSLIYSNVYEDCCAKTEEYEVKTFAKKEEENPTQKRKNIVVLEYKIYF